MDKNLNDTGVVKSQPSDNTVEASEPRAGGLFISPAAPRPARTPQKSGCRGSRKLVRYRDVVRRCFFFEDIHPARRVTGLRVTDLPRTLKDMCQRERETDLDDSLWVRSMLATAENYTRHGVQHPHAQPKMGTGITPTNSHATHGEHMSCVSWYETPGKRNAPLECEARTRAGTQ